jgi:hypothetical protein
MHARHGCATRACSLVHQETDMTATTGRKPSFAKPYLLMSAGTLVFLAFIGVLGWTLTTLAQG